MDRRRAILLLSATCTSLLAKPIEAFASAMPFSWYGSTLRLVSSAVITPFKYYDGSRLRRLKHRYRNDLLSRSQGRIQS